MEDPEYLRTVRYYETISRVMVIGQIIVWLSIVAMFARH